MALWIGCNTLFPDEYFPDPNTFTLEKLRVSLDRLAALNFEAVEFSHYMHLSDGEATEAGEYCRSLGLLAWSAHAAGSAAVATASEREKTLAEKALCIRLAERLGVKIMVYHVASYDSAVYAAGVPADLLRAEAAVLAELSRQASDVGIRIAVENGESVAVMNYLIALVNEVDSEALGICVDTGHAALGDLGPARAIRMAADKLYSLHLQDNWGGADHHLPPGCGKIDWCEVAQALAEVNYRGVLMAECTDSPLGHRPYHKELELRIAAATLWRLRESVRGARLGDRKRRCC
ncbi:MAG: sugar phosphate isomerase/epimerase [Armatimonadetes bacterium]|nr:sugar phosphate isomerase/epimerase [Armatimonadota bacterium]